MKFICFLLFALLLFSCSKEDSCLDHTIGTYGGFVSGFGVVQGEMSMSKAATGGYDLVITDNFIDGAGVTYNGTLSGDCKTIMVPQQTTVAQGASSYSISGTFQIDDGTLTGSLVVDAVVDVTLNYYLVKK